MFYALILSAYLLFKVETEVFHMPRWVLLIWAFQMGSEGPFWKPDPSKP